MLMFFSHVLHAEPSCFNEPTRGSRNILVGILSPVTPQKKNIIDKQQKVPVPAGRGWTDGAAEITMDQVECVRRATSSIIWERGALLFPVEAHATHLIDVVEGG